MSKVAIAYLTRDRVELVRQSLPPLLAGAHNNQYHLFVVDGSTTEVNEKTIWELAYPAGHMHANIRGGAGAAIVYALTLMIQHKENYEYVGLCESDVLLCNDWFPATFDLFSRGNADGLQVGAVSARCYVDRVLFQRDSYAICHNLGAGQIIFTRGAAQAVLNNFRTAWSSDNRRIFSQLCGVDIAAFWAFRANEHYLTADFHWEPVMASIGLAALALTPSPCEMIGQNPPLAEQGLTIVSEPSELRADETFKRYAMELKSICAGELVLGIETKFHFNPNDGTWTYFPHQMHMLGGKYSGDWRLKEVRGFGTFGWVAGESLDRNSTFKPQDGTEWDAKNLHEHYSPQLIVPVFGSVSLLVSGGKDGGKIEVVDEGSGFKASPDMPPEGEGVQVLQMQIPGGLNYRNLRITALTPGIVFYGMQSREKQPHLPNVSFDYSVLPPA